MSKQSNDKMAAKLIMCFVAIAIVCTIVVLVMKMKTGIHTSGTSDSAAASAEVQSAGTAAAGSTAASAATGSTAAAVSTEGTTLEASNAAVETPATQFDLSTLDNTEEPFGYSTQNLDENNIPTDWKWYYNQWGQFNAMWIGDTTQKVVYLTMDEGFANDLTSTELDILKEKNVKCTFMLTKDFVDTAKSLGCCRVAPLLTDKKGRVTDKEVVDYAHDNGMKVTGWMVQDLETWKVAKAAGCDCTTSDHPMALLKAIKESCAK